MYNILISILLFTIPETDKVIDARSIYNYCIEINIKHPEIVTAQSIWETGWYKCNNCSLDKNNLFGFYYKGDYIKFTNWKESINYYKRWQDKYYDKERNYYDFLECIYINNKGNCIKYCEDPVTYNLQLKKTIIKHEKYWKNN